MTEADFPEKVMQQQEAIRQSGVINMFDREGVKQLARDEFGFEELANWIDKHPDEYIDMAERAAEVFRDG